MGNSPGFLEWPDQHSDREAQVAQRGTQSPQLGPRAQQPGLCSREEHLLYLLKLKRVPGAPLCTLENVLSYLSFYPLV